MTRNDGDWITRWFTARVTDWTPSPARHACRVLFAPASRDAGASTRFATLLSDSESERAYRLLTEDGRARFIQRRAFRRYCGAIALADLRPVSQVDFRETENGRPYLPELPRVRFSFSACRLGFLAAWSAAHAIGVDLEDTSKGLAAADLARRFFSDAEAKTVEDSAAPARQRAFFQLWSLKEAALKSIGEGLPFGLDAFEFRLRPDPRTVRAPRDHGGPEQFGAHLIDRPGTCAAVVIRSG